MTQNNEAAPIYLNMIEKSTLTENELQVTVLNCHQGLNVRGIACNWKSQGTPKLLTNTCIRYVMKASDQSHIRYIE